MTDAVDFNILAVIPSGPDALLVSKACSNSPQSREAQEGKVRMYSHLVNI